MGVEDPRAQAPEEGGLSPLGIALHGWMRADPRTRTEKGGLRPLTPAGPPAARDAARADREGSPG
jgi:hypothetical protein